MRLRRILVGKNKQGKQQTEMKPVVYKMFLKVCTCVCNKYTKSVDIFYSSKVENVKDSVKAASLKNLKKIII